MCTAELAAGLHELGSAARLLQDVERTVFLPAYGCALLAVDAAEQAAALQPDEVQLHLLCLDGWEFGVHRWGRGVAGGRQGAACIAVRKAGGWGTFAPCESAPCRQVVMLSTPP
jgi:hypothetical protein